LNALINSHWQNFGSGGSKFSHIVSAINQWNPASISMVAIDWIHMWKNGLLVDQVIDREKIKVYNM
jgi:hypothetical protein